jgi:hypothetical protein
MQSGREKCVWGIVASAAIGALAACNHFDDTEQFRVCPECFDDGGGGDGVAGNDVAPGGDAGADTGPPIVVADSDLPECPPDAPDLDDDKFVAKNSGLACGTDCDDIEPRAHPGQTDWFTWASELAEFDWNCDGKVELHFTDLAVCANPTTAGDPCVFSEGWLDPKVPICGYTAKWVTSCAELSGPGTCGVPPGGLESRMQECH